MRNMQLMFGYASSFNQNLNSWNVSKLTNTRSMFQGATLFSQNLCIWKDTFTATLTSDMFTGTACSNTSSPDLNANPPGPFCYNCEAPSQAPSVSPVPSKSSTPSSAPSLSAFPSFSPSADPSNVPSEQPSQSVVPSTDPSSDPNLVPSKSPMPSTEPTVCTEPSQSPSCEPVDINNKTHLTTSVTSYINNPAAFCLPIGLWNGKTHNACYASELFIPLLG